MRALTWYFDFVSPFAYIGLHRLKELPPDVTIAYRPILFAGLLNHWGQKGPAEMASKRRYTYRWSHWWAQNLGTPLRYPAVHPFNPLHHLRLALACGSTAASIRTIFEDLWTTGGDPSDPARFAMLLERLGKRREDLEDAAVKNALRANTEAAIARGVFGVPTTEVDGELFWGADSMDYLKAFLADPAVLRNDEVRRLDAMPVGAARKA